MTPSIAVFIILAAIAVVSALNVILRRNPVHSAIFLAFTIVCLAGIFVLLNAEFIAATEVIIYAGAIIVLFLFTMMLLDVRGGMMVHQFQRQTGVAAPVAILILLCLLGVAISVINVTGLPAATISPGAAARLGSVQNLGQELYSNFLLPFELASLVLTVGLVGAIGLAGRADEDSEEQQRIAAAEAFDANIRATEGGTLEPEEGAAVAGHHS
ncbi:MAG TPA: NADH-quinone oxidoreductase subunit J [Chloroflexota bacterium]|nr:NADH-quinone oxidoreductase subunit J [Chloroflexota bacterium]